MRLFHIVTMRYQEPAFHCSCPIIFTSHAEALTEI